MVYGWLTDSQQKRPLGIFEGPQPSFTASYYIKRIAEYSGAGPYSLVTALVYLERLQRACPDLRITSGCMQRLLLVAVMVAEKYLEDDPRNNAIW
jgi:hypothetical protein